MTRKKTNKSATPRKSRQALVFEELEPRLLLSADLPIDIPAVLAPDRGDDEPVSVHEGITTAAVTEEQYVSHELVFVDTDTPDYQLLVDDLLSNSSEDLLIEVVLLNNNSDGIAQITSALSEYRELDAVHIISHGSEGSIDLGGSRLEFDTLLANSAAIQGWAEAFSESGDLLIYGCNLAASEDGQSLVDSLARLTGADVAASDDLTGSEELGGDWELEYNTGQIETVVAFSQGLQTSWSATLAMLSVTTTADTNDGDTSSIAALSANMGADGEISLREAILAANATAGTDTISFNIDTSDAGYLFYEDDGIAGQVTAGNETHTPGTVDADFSKGWYSIKPTSVLPNITDAVIIDGTTQAGYTDSPIIEIDSTNATGTDANVLTLQAGNSTIKGLVINRGQDDAIEVEINGGNTIVGNYIGTDVSGTLDLGNGWGLAIKTDNNVIGGTDPAERNIISGNTNYGVAFYLSASNNILQGNYIGVDVTGVNALGNSGEGVEISGGASNNTIGGTAAGAGNIIAYNGSDGVDLQADAGTGNAILGNSIFSNTGQGIDLSPNGVNANDTGDSDTGANNLQNYPLLTSVVTDGTGNVTINGSINSTANTDFRLEFFSNTTADGTGYGEAETYLGFVNVTTDGSGNATFSAALLATVATGEFVTATATVDLGGGAYGDTSEFAQNVTAVDNIGTAIWRGNSTTPQTSDWNGTSFGTTTATAPVGDYRIIQGAEAPTRDEIIIIGVDESANISGEMWNGSSWTALPFNDMATGLSESFYWSFDVAYESTSGDAMLVWRNGTNGTEGLSYRVWDGSTWSAEQTITTPLSGEPKQMHLVASPNSEEMILVVGDSASQNYALVWDGTSWGNGQHLDTGGKIEAVEVAYEQQTGRAMVVYGKASNDTGDDLYYRFWDGSSWSGENTYAPATVANRLGWSVIASDPNSDRIALAGHSTAGEVWLSVWDGSAWGSTLEVASDSDYVSPNIAVSFESDSGQLLATYGKSATDSTIYYRTWDSGSGWSSEQTVPSTSVVDVNSMTLDAAPTGDKIMLAVQDDDNDLNYVLWDGTSWGTPTELETNTTEIKNQPFLFLWDQNYTNTTPVATADSYTLGENTTLTTTLGVNGLLNNDTDPDGDSLTVNTTPVAGPSHGSLTLNADGTFTYTPNANFADSDSFTYQIEDGNGGTDTATVTLTVTPDATNEAPLNAVPGSQVGGKDTPLVFSDANGNQIIVHDDAGGNALEITLTAGNGVVTLADTTGLTITGGADGSGTITFTGTLSDINIALNGLSFTPTAGYTGSASLQIITNDQGNTGTGGALSDSDTIAIDVVQVNQAPINTVPAAQSIDQDSLLLFSTSKGTAISISDADAGSNAVEVTLTATNGTLTLAGNTGLTFSTGDGSADSTMTFTGTITDINTALEGMYFLATPGFSGTASVQINTDDLGNSGAGGSLTANDTVSITVGPVHESLWLSTIGSATDGATSWNAGDLVDFGDPSLAFEPGTSSGTFTATGFGLDSFAGRATDITAIHVVGSDISVGSNAIQLLAGDLILSSDATETLTGSDGNPLVVASKDAFVFRPDTPGDYSSGTFFMLINGADVGLGSMTGITLVEQTTVVGAGAGSTTLQAGDFLIAHDGVTRNIERFAPGTLGASTTGSRTLLIDGADIGIGANIHGVELIETSTTIGGVTLQSGQILVSLAGDDNTVGNNAISTTRQDVFILDITQTGSTTVGDATLFLEGNDTGLDTGNNAESVNALSLMPNLAPVFDNATLNVNENSPNGTLLGIVTGSDPDGDPLNYTVLSGNTGGAFAINASTGEITVANSGALDFETTPIFTLTVAAVDDSGAYTSATVTINLNNVDEPGVNDAPENTVPGAQTIDRDGMLLFSSATGTAISISDFDAGTNPVQVTLTATNGTLNLSGTQGLTFSTGDGMADATMTFTGTIADINAALEGMTFVATASFTGTASLQITTDDLGNTGSGGALSDTDSVSIDVQSAGQGLWMTLLDDETTGNTDIPTITGGDVVLFENITQLETSNTDKTAAVTAGTFTYQFNLDTVLLSDGVTTASDGNTIVNATHYVSRDIQVGSNNLQLLTGDLILSTDGDEVIDGVTYKREDIFVFRPDTFGDYSQGSFFMLVDGSDIGLGKVTAVSLVESTTTVGDVTLNAGEFLIGHDGSGNNIDRYVPGTLGDISTGVLSILVKGGDVDIGQKIGGIHLVQSSTTLGGVSLTAGQLLVSLQGEDSAVGNGTTIDVLRFDIFVLDVTATGDGSSAATASRFFEGLDESLDSNKEAVSGISLMGNAAPSITAETFSVDENSANGTVVGAVTASDPENATLSYAITAGNTGGAFTIDAATGQITVANSAALDFETTPSFSLTVSTIDDSGAYGSATVTVNLNDINDAPTVSLTNLVNNLTEDSDTSTAIKIADVVIADDALGTNNLTLTGADAASFEIVGTELRLKAGTSLDFETKASFDVTVQVDDAAIPGAPDDTALHTLNITDVNEAPTVSLINTTTTFPEDTDTSTRIKVADIVIADDALGTNTLTLSGADAALFEIDTGVLYLKAGTVLDFETNPSPDVTVAVDDAAIPGSPEDTAALAVTITDVNEFAVGPVTDSDAAVDTVAEDAIVGTSVGITGLATDADGTDTVTYSLSDDASGLFTIDTNTGVVTVNAALDAETATSHSITVVATSSDTSTNSQNYTITVTDVDEFNVGVVTDADGAANTVAESAFVGDAVGITAAASDADVDNTVTYSLSDDAGGLFAIDANTGVITAANALDYEAATSHSVTVLATSSDTSTSSQTFTISITDVSEFVVGPVTDNDAAADTVAEDAIVGTAVGITALATDSDGSDTVTYSLSDNAGGLFAIDTNTGIVTVSAALDAETATSHSITVVATSSDTSASPQSYTIAVTDVDEFNVGAVTDADGAANTVAESAIVGDAVGITASASDADVDDTITYSLSDDAGGLFSIDANTGVITVANALDYETATSHNITVLATSDDLSTSSQVFSISVTDVNEAVVGPVTDNDGTADTVAEDATVGTSVGITGLATDADGTDTVTYSLSDDAGGLFAIDANTGVITVANALDYETATSHSVTVIATSSDTSTSSQAFTINVTDVNEFAVGPVTDNDGTADTVAEDAIAGTTVGITGLATDADGTDTVTYSLSDDAGGLFTIDTNSGVITVANALDYETATSHSVTVIATSSDTSTSSQAFTINVTDVNEFAVGPVTDNDGTADTVAEDAIAGTTVGITGLATDADGTDTVTYSLSDDAGGLFTIDTNSGVITVANALDYETATSHSVTVFATSSDTSTSSQAFTINVTDVNESAVGPVTDSDAAADTVAEDAIVGSAVGITALATDADGTDTVTYSLSDDAGGLFTIDSNTGVITVANALDYETATSHSVTVLATSSDTSTSSQAFTISVTDVNEFSVGPVTDNDGTADTVAEDAIAGTTVGITGLATDADGTDTVTYSLSDDAGGLFTIDSNTGVITVANALDYETATSHSVTVLAISSDTSTSSQAFTISITDVNEFAVGPVTDNDGTADTVAEDAIVGTTVGVTGLATDADGTDTVTYSLSNDAGGLFTIDANTGVITVANALDYETATSHSVTVLATSSDTSTSSQAFTINVTDVNESAVGSVTDNDGTADTVAEDAIAGTTVGITGLATDADGTDTVTYSLSDDAGGLFTIDANTGVITVANALDFETATSHSVTVLATSSDASTSSQAFTISVTDVNEFAVGAISDTDAAVDSVAENAIVGDAVGITGLATDADGTDTVTYSLSDDAGGLFAIDTNTGVITVANALDYETATSHSVTVLATSSDTSTSSQAFTVNVTDVNESAVGAISDTDAAVDSVAENAGVGDAVGITASATDPDGTDTVTYSLSDDAGGLFAIDANTGVVTVANALDYETAISHNITIVATSSDTSTSSQVFSISVTDVNESAVGPVTDNDGTADTVAEDAIVGTSVGITGLATDADGTDTVTYSLSDDAGGLFAIDANTGVITVANALDYETATSHSVTVLATSSDASTSSQAFIISITDVNESAVGSVTDNDGTADTVAEDAITGTTVGVTALATDADGTDTVTYSLSDDAGGLFAIDTNTGVITVANALDYETATSHSVTVLATSSDTSTSSQAFTISVTDVNEFAVGPVTDNDGTANTVAEGAIVGTSVGITGLATDADGTDTVTYSLSNDAGGLFAIDTNTGVITVANALDYETATSHSVTVLATSSDTSTSSQAFTVNVTDVNEFAVGAISDTDAAVDSVAENAIVGDAVGITGLATDADGTDTVTYSLSDDAGGLFTIDANTGVITVANALDYETATTHSVTVLATSSDTSTSSQAFTVNVTDVNESVVGPVTDNDGTANSVAEDAIVGTTVGITALATDPDGTDTVTYSLSGDAGGLFAIDTNTGIVTVNAALDAETATSHSITVVATSSDTSTSSQSYTITVTDVDEFNVGAVTDTDGAANTVAENAGVGDAVGITAAASDADVDDTVTYSLSDDAGGLFAIDANTGVITVANALDYETATSHSVTVLATSSDTSTNSQAFTINVTDVNEFAVGLVTDNDGAADTVSEDAVVGTSVGITGLATDADGTDTVTYSLSDDAGGLFTIDANTGVITVANALDFETATSHSVTVLATSSDTSTSSQAFTINVTDVNESAVGSVTDNDGTADTVAEDAIAGTTVGITGLATDADGTDTVTYSLSDDAGGLFTIDANTGVITVANALDFETATSHSVTVLATSSDTSTSSQAFTISVTDVNEFAVGPVTDNDGTANSVAEDAIVGTTVGITALATDPDGTDTVTYSLSDDAGGLFAIDTNTGIVTVNAALDAETATSHSITVVATSSDTSTSSQSYTITVTDVDEFNVGAVTDTDGAANTVAENAGVGDAVGITAAASDADVDDTVTYSLSDDAGGLFTIDANTGVITVANALDYETATSHSVTVLATSSDTSTSSQAFTINVTDVNESAVGSVTDNDGTADTVAEDAIAGTTVGITGLATDADGTDTVTYSLSDDAGGLFTIDANTGVITVANALDYETATSHSVTVMATSSDTSTSSQAFTINITDVDESAVGPVTDNDAAADAVAEDAIVGTSVGVTGLATDADGTDTVTYSLSDDAGGLFAIDANTGVITVANALDYETATSHSVTVLATSSDTSTSSQAFSINVTDVNESAVGAISDTDAAADSVAENAGVGDAVGITAFATDADGSDTVTYSLSDDAGGLFTIDANTGVITVANALDYETAISHSVTVLATSSDTSTSSQAFTINITDVNESAVGPVTDNDAAADAVAEDAIVGTSVGVTGLATDADGTDTVTYSLSDDAGGLFAIDANTGVITVANALDYETATSHSVTVLATSSDTSTSSQAFTINVTDVNESAVGPVTDNDGTADTVAEDATVGTSVGVTGLATDADGTDTVTYSLSDDAGGLFAIDANTGVITVANALDYETATSHSVTVLATSSDTSISSQAFTISVTDVNEFAVGPVTDNDGTANTVAEDAIVGTSVGITGLATDADGTDTVTYSLSDDAGGLFTIDANTGVITVANALDYETATSHSVTMLATSSDTSTSSQAFTITVTDVNESAVGLVTDNDGTANTVAEDALVGDTVGITALATDADGTDTVTYSLSDDAGGLFAIDTNTGVITVANALDYETATSHSVTVLATSSDTSTSSQAFTINITDVNESAVGPVTDNDGTADTVAEDAIAGTTVGITGLATDADGTDTVTYSLSDDAGGLFSIDANTGVVTVANALDYETATSHSVTVLATSSDASTSSQAFTINITDVNESAVGPVTDNDGTADTVAEDAIAGTTVGITGLATDADGTDTVTYSLSDDAGGLFTIDANTGVITVANALDYETATSHSVTVLATSSDTSTSSQAFTVNVTDVNESVVGPVTDNDGTANTVAEDAVVGTTVGVTGLATDADGTDTVTYSLSDDAGGLFSIDANTGVITVANALDYETATSHSVTVLATSSDTSTSSQVFTINITDVNESAVGPVTDNDGTANTVAEDAVVGTSVGITGLATDADGTDTVTYSLSNDAGGLFTIDANTGVITVANALDFETATSHSVTVLATSSDTSISSQAFTINITDVNEFSVGPVSDSNAAANTVAEDAVVGTSVGITGLATDADGTDTVTYSLSDDAGGLFAIDSNTGAITVANALDYETATSHNITVLATSDDLSTSSQVFSISVTDVNEAPAFTSLAVTAATEDAAYSYTITTTDPDSGASLSITATTLPSWLTLTDNGDGTATLSGTPTNAEVGGHTVLLDVSDGALSDTQSFAITVANTNDAPVATADSFTVNEGSTTNLALATNDTDADDGLDLTRITVVSAPTNGSIVVNADGTVDYTHDGSETVSDSFTYTIDDLGGVTSNTVTVNLTVDPVNDAPIHSVPGAQGTPGNTPLIFSSLNGNSITVADPDASGAAMEVTLSVSNGTLSLAGTSGLSFNVGDGSSDATMTFTGAAADINAALNGLSFQADADYQGTASVQIITDDLGNVGTGGALNALDRVSIAVTASAPTGIAQDTLLTLDELILEDTLDLPAPEPVLTAVNTGNVDPAAEEATDAATPASGTETTPTPDPAVDALPGSGRGIPTQADVSLPGALPLFDHNLQPYDDDRPTSIRLIGHAIRQGLVDPFSYAKMLNPLQPDMAIWESIEAMMDQMDGRDTSWYRDDQVLTTTTATGLTVSFTVGYVSWLLRAGYLSASLMSVLPLWREFDPLPVLATTKEKKRKSADRDKDSQKMNDIESERIFTSNETV